MTIREIPIALIHKENSNKTLQGIYLEQHQHFDILWYHWPQDGFFPVVDYEPVILIYDNKNRICCVCIRRGWEYKPAKIDELEYPIEIGFDGSFHHPYLHYKNDGKNFENRFVSCVQPTIQPVSVAKNKIPSISRTGKGHPTLLKKLGKEVMDPYDKAQKLRSEYCAENI